MRGARCNLEWLFLSKYHTWTCNQSRLQLVVWSSKTFSGSDHSHSGFNSQAQIMRSQSNLSTELLKAAASALKVLLTTRGTFFTCPSNWSNNCLLISQKFRGGCKDDCSAMCHAGFGGHEAGIGKRTKCDPCWMK